MLRTILRRFGTCLSERRPRAAGFGYTLLPVVDIDHSVRGVLRTVLRRFCTGPS